MRIIWEFKSIRSMKDWTIYEDFSKKFMFFRKKEKIKVYLSQGLYVGFSQTRTINLNKFPEVDVG